MPNLASWMRRLQSIRTTLGRSASLTAARSTVPAATRSQPVAFLEEMTACLARWKPADVDEVAHLLVTYRPRRYPKPNPLHLEMLKDAPDPRRLFRKAPNREAVEHNLAASIQAFESALPTFLALDTGHPVRRWQDLLQLNIQHVTRSERHFTNGQALVTGLRLEDGRFSLALHDDVEAFLSELQTRPSLIAQRLVSATTEEGCCAVAARWLSDVTERRIAVRVDGSPASLSWRTWGWVTGPAGYRKRGLVLSVNDRSVWVELDEQPGAKSEEYAVLNQLPGILPGVEAETCATCSSFAFSGMTRDMSGGKLGYCQHPDARVDSGAPLVAVAFRCDWYAKVLDRDRPRPYLRAP